MLVKLICFWHVSMFFQLQGNTCSLLNKFEHALRCRVLHYFHTAFFCINAIGDSPQRYAAVYIRWNTSYTKHLVTKTSALSTAR